MHPNADKALDWCVAVAGRHPHATARVATVAATAVALIVAVAMPGFWPLAAVAVSASLVWVAFTYTRAEPEPEVPPVEAIAELEPPDLLNRVFRAPVRDVGAHPGPVENLRHLQIGYQVNDRGTDVEPWAIRLWGTPLLIAGLQGAGKSVILGEIFAAAAPWIHHGDVVVYALDPKGGMELDAYRPLFAEYWDPDEAGEDEDTLGTGAAVLLGKACVELRRKAGEAKRLGQKAVTPSQRQPLLVVVIDELATFTYGVKDAKLRTRIQSQIAYIASQGRAPAVNLLAAVQDPRKEIVDQRDLFPQRIGVAMMTAAQTNMVMGDHAVEAGALCHAIPETQPGVAYFKSPDRRSYPRVKAIFRDEAEVKRIVMDYPAPRSR